MPDNDNARPAKRPRLMQISIPDLLNHSQVYYADQARESVDNVEGFSLCHERLSVHVPLAARSQEDERSTHPHLQKNEREMKAFSNIPSSQVSNNQMGSAGLVCFGSVG